MKKYPMFVPLLFLLACAQKPQEEPKTLVDPRSYNLGIIGAFGEVVNAGVKKLAMSEALPPSEMDALMAEAEKVAERNHVLLYREPDLIVTDLFPADVAKGKEVLLIYQGTTKEEYLALKEEVKTSERSGMYSGKIREEISIRFGRLLSYPDRYIRELIAANRSEEQPSSDTSGATQ